MNDVQIAVVGNVVTDIRYSVTDAGLPVAGFRMAATPRRFDRETGGWVDGESSFYSVSCWRALADNVAASLAKGDPVCVVGRLRIRSWERDGLRGTSAEVDAQAVGHDLGRGISAFRRGRRTAEGERVPGTPAEAARPRSPDEGLTPEPAGIG